MMATLGRLARVFAAIGTLLWPSIAHAVQLPVGTITGTVQAGSGPTHAFVSGAQITLLGEPALTTTTNDDGAFRFEKVLRSPVVLVVRRLGFRAESVSVAVPLAAALTIDLEPAALALTPVVIRADGAELTGPFAGFHRRREKGFGYFITHDQIARRRPQHISDLFRLVPNMTVEREGSLDVVRMRGRTCDPLVWADGVPLVGGFLDLDALPPQSLEGIEIYSGVSTVPPELIGPRDAGACGVIVVWSRHGVPSGKRAAKSLSSAELATLVTSQGIYTAEQVDTPATFAKGAALVVAYPDSLRLARATGRVLAEFVVDTAGLIEPTTIGIVYASHPLFAAAVRTALSGATFTPARRGHAHVRQLVQLPVSFDGATAASTARPQK
jgi:hypothetical protein